MKSALLGFLFAALFLISCSSEATPTTTHPADPTPTTTREPEPTATQKRLDTQEPSSQSPWIRDRIRAIEALYGFTEAGRQWLEQYDLRQMVGQPGWFGSFGYQGWAGVGQAIPSSVLHELSHSYYGAFQVTGRPDLNWDVRQEGEPSTALHQYREDLKTFMFQPPDRYEPLRDRFRNLPNLSKGQYPDLFHFGEADLISMVGGDLNLVPLILQKYFDRFLKPGEQETWDEALRWYLGLATEDRKVADGYLGLAHFPLNNYRGMRPLTDSRVSDAVLVIVEGEERQRLGDFAQRYDLIKSEKFSLVDAASVDGDFKFWRSLIRQMLDLHRKHPEVLAEQAGSQGVRLGTALNTFLEAENLSHREQVELFRPRLDDPLIADFAVLLPSRVLVDLFGEESQGESNAPVQQVIGKFTEKLQRFVRATNAAITLGKEDLLAGTAEFQRFLAELSDEEQERNLDIILDLLWEAERDTASKLLNGMSDTTILRIFENNPAATINGHVQPERLLEVLQITTDASQRRFAEGMESLLGNTSGNIQIDAPFTALAYSRLSDRGTKNPQEALTVLQETHVPLSAQPYSGYLLEQQRAASIILAANLERAAALIASREGYGESAHRIIHTLIFNDPDLAGKIVATLSAQGEEAIVVEALIVFAYDAERLDANPDLSLSLEKDKEFLQYLMDTQGGVWVQQRMDEAIRRYDALIREEEMDQEFLRAYAETLRQTAALERDSARRMALEETFDEAFQGATGRSLSAYR